MKREKHITIGLTEDEFETLKKNHQESDFAGRTLNAYCRNLLFNTKYTENSTNLNEEVRTQLDEIGKIMKVYGYFAEKSDDPTMKKLFYQYNKRVQDKLNSLM